MTKPHSFCHFCGAKHISEEFPKVCGACGASVYLNPVPVAVVLVPIGDGLLVGRRGIEPCYGMYAHTGGYMDLGETPEQTASRELQEEVGILIPKELMKFLGIRVSKNGNLLIFYRTPPLVKEVMKGFCPSHEVIDIKVITEPTELAFSSHTEMADLYFAGKV